ncbi:MAG: alanine racemase [Parasphingorhabdus sp.]
MPFAALETPQLLLDVTKLDANTARMKAHVERLGSRLRPHLKTTKSVDLARHVLGDLSHPITVSTLKEADYFAGHGARDILYAVGIAENKMDHVVALRRKDVDLTIILDNLASAAMVVARAAAAEIMVPVLIEIDSDGHRSGVEPQSGALVAIGRLLEDGAYTLLRGVMTHAGASYDCRTTACIEKLAAQERSLTLGSAEMLREAGMACPVVSIGSTPTALFSKNLDGVTEVRAGVFMSHDLVMAGLGVCAPEDIALSVLATVIGHQPAKGWVITDAGWMAMSRDRGTSGHGIDQGYGLVADEYGRLLGDVVVNGANQEHGILTAHEGKPLDISGFPIGMRLRILPNHACATAAQYGEYLVVDSGSEILTRWERINGW